MAREPFIFHTDTAEFRETVAELMKRTKYKTIPDFLGWRAKILTYDLISWTPPRAKRTDANPGGDFHDSGRTNWPAQKQAGENQIKYELIKLFPPLSTANVISHPVEGLIRWARYIEKYIKERNLSAIAKMLQDIGLPVPYVLMEASEDVHQGARGDRGRVRANVRYPVVVKASVQKLIKQVIKRVGKLKAGWMKAANALGVKGLPVWITTHVGIPGEYIDDRWHPRFPSITVGNGAPAATDMDPNEIVGPAIIANQNKMKKELEAILAWEFKKASAKGRR